MTKRKVTTFLDEEVFTKVRRYKEEFGLPSFYEAAAVLIQKGLASVEQRGSANNEEGLGELDEDASGKDWGTQFSIATAEAEADFRRRRRRR